MRKRECDTSRQDVKSNELYLENVGSGIQNPGRQTKHRDQVEAESKALAKVKNKSKN